jgi:hypothetical protein
MLKRVKFGLVLAALSLLCLCTSYLSVHGSGGAPRRLLVRGAAAALAAGGGGARGAPAAPARAAPAPFRALLHNHKLLHGYEKGARWDPGFWYFYEAGWYPIHVVADAFVACEDAARGPTLVVMSRRYRHTPQLNHSELLIEVVGGAGEGARRVSLGPGEWEDSGLYESVAIGRYALPAHASAGAAAACAPLGAAAATAAAAPPLTLRMFINTTFDYSAYFYEDLPDRPPEAFYRGAAEQYFNVTRSPEPPRSDFAMVAIFSFSHYLLPLWMNYWRAIGVDTFYLFYNGPPEHIPALQREVADFGGSVVIISWQVIHWLTTEPNDITHGQPIAINSAFQRWRHLHKFMAFYDTDELLVTPHHDSLQHFLESYRAFRGPVTALRSMCSWAMLVNLTDHNLTSVAQVRLEHLASLPVQRGPPGGREKYLVNVSAAAEWGVRFVNLHGVYSHQGQFGPGSAEVMAPEGSLPAYHLHLLNKDVGDDSQKNDSREVFMPAKGKEIVDDHLKDLLRRALAWRIAHKGRARGEWGG